MAAPDFYDADYFLRGQETGKSLYTDYRWLPDLTIPMAKAIAAHLGMRRNDTVMDFGCARGYLVRALQHLGYIAHGYDSSQWVIDHCDPLVASHVSTTWDNHQVFDWVIAKDVLEHLDFLALQPTLRQLAAAARNGLFIVVPLAPTFGQPYTVPEYDKDPTHSIRMDLHEWVNQLEYTLGHRDWTFEYGYRVAGVKDNYYLTHPEGNGFLTARRLS